HSSNNF
nr:Chain A, HSSNNF hexapeptide segment from Islet Amyloid Polypeptide [synthetic construct]